MVAWEETLDLDGEPGDDRPATAHALPAFDEFLLGYGDRSAQLGPIDEQRIVPGSNGVFSPTLVLDGRVVGTWRRSHRAGRVLLEGRSFAPLTDAERESLTAALCSYAAFVEQPAEVRWVG